MLINSIYIWYIMDIYNMIHCDREPGQAVTGWHIPAWQSNCCFQSEPQILSTDRHLLTVSYRASQSILIFGDFRIVNWNIASLLYLSYIRESIVLFAIDILTWLTLCQWHHLDITTSTLSPHYSSLSYLAPGWSLPPSLSTRYDHPRPGLHIEILQRKFYKKCL